MPGRNRRITRELANQLPLKQRIAWGSSVVQCVMIPYSDYFRETYKVDQALTLAWRFATGAEDNPSHRKRLEDEIGNLSERGDEEGYGFQTVLIAAHLLEEIRKNDGKAMYAAVEDSAYAFADVQLFRHNLTSGNQATSEEYGEYIESLARIVVDFTLRAHQHFLNLPDSLISQQTAYSEELKPIPLPLRGVGVARAGQGYPKAPIHELKARSGS